MHFDPVKLCDRNLDWGLAVFRESVKELQRSKYLVLDSADVDERLREEVTRSAGRV